MKTHHRTGVTEGIVTAVPRGKILILHPLDQQAFGKFQAGYVIG